MKIWAVVPAHNEKAHIEKTLATIALQKIPIVIVDDGSTDNTSNLAQKYGTVLRHVINLGKGAALRTGCDYAFDSGAEAVVVLDSDGQHDPAMIHMFIDKLKKNNDIVYGYRDFTKNMPLVPRLGNYGLSAILAALFGENLKDTQSGYRAFTKKAYSYIRWQSNDYTLESEMIARAGLAGLKYVQIPIPTIYHDSYKGTTMFDGFTIFFKMIMWRFKL